MRLSQYSHRFVERLRVRCCQGGCLTSSTGSASDHLSLLGLSLCPLANRLFMHRSTKVDFSQSVEAIIYLLLTLPNIIGLISSLGGFFETFKATYYWDSIMRHALEASPIPVSGTEVRLCALDHDEVALFRFACCRLVLRLSLCAGRLYHSILFEQCCLVYRVLHLPSRTSFAVLTPWRSKA